MRELTRFLLVEDHPFQRMLLEQSLRRMGYQSIVTAEDGAQAMRVLGSTSVDIIVTDLMMPDVDGIELILMLRKLAPDAAVILASADQASLDVAGVLATAHGIRLIGSFSKPIRPDSLQLLLDAYFQDRAAQAASQ